MVSQSAGAPALKYRDVNTETSSPGEAKGLIKSILFFIISSIFLLIFWFYISIFCYIYENTQIHLLTDTLISFGLSLLYPFVIYIFPGIFRIPALSRKKKNEENNGKGKYLYNFSKFLQFF